MSSTFLERSLISLSSFSKFFARPIFFPSNSPTDPPEILNLRFVTFPLFVINVLSSEDGMFLMSPSATYTLSKMNAINFEYFGSNSMICVAGKASPYICNGEGVNFSKASKMKKFAFPLLASLNILIAS